MHRIIVYIYWYSAQAFTLQLIIIFFNLNKFQFQIFKKIHINNFISTVKPVYEASKGGIYGQVLLIQTS